MSFILGSMAMQVVIKRHGRDRGAPVRKHVLIAFCDEADDLGRISARYEGKLANEHLARRAECDASTASRAKGELVNDGWLIPVGQQKRGRGRVTLYRVNVDKLRIAVRAVQADLRAVEEAELSETPGGQAILDGPVPSPESAAINGFDEGQGAENADQSQISCADKALVSGQEVNAAPQALCKTGGNEAQAADCKGEPGKVVQISPEGREVVQISPESCADKHPNPINPPPPYSPPPPVSAVSSDAPVTWSVLKARLSEAVGREAALCLISGASITNGTLIFSDRFKFAEARQRHGELLAGAGVRVITMDTPDAEAVRLKQAGKV